MRIITIATATPSERRLYIAASKARENAYAPYSNFWVGAAVQDVNGTIHVGCNVENASYGATICAERIAICSMVATGVKKIRRLCCVLEGDDSPDRSPCGICCQVIAEFVQGDTSIEIILGDPRSANLRITNIGELLPQAFRLK